jgi:hypothetical protein
MKRSAPAATTAAADEEASARGQKGSAGRSGKGNKGDASGTLCAQVTAAHFSVYKVTKISLCVDRPGRRPIRADRTTLRQHDALIHPKTLIRNFGNPQFTIRKITLRDHFTPAHRFLLSPFSC